MNLETIQPKDWKKPSGYSNGVLVKGAGRLLFVAGPTKAMPVEITSFAIRETLFDRALQPIRAEVTIGLEVVTFPPDSDDLIGQGALEYQKTVKDAQAVLNLGKAIVGVTEIIPF